MSEPEAFNGIHEHLRRIEHTAEETSKRIEEKLDKISGDHEIRLRQLERWRYALPTSLVLGLAGVVAAVFNARGK